MDKAQITEFIRKSFDNPDEDLDFPGTKIQQIK